MVGRVNIASLAMLLIVLLVGGAQGHHDDDRPHTLIGGSWVCVSQAAYGQAAAAQRAGKDVQALRKELRNENGEDLCIFIDDEILEDMMAPWVRVLGQEGDQIQVAFTVEFYQRLSTVHRRFSRVQFTGWTGAGNLDIYIQ